MQKQLLAAVLFLPLTAMSQQPHCKHAQARSLQLDLAGVSTVVFDVGHNELALAASPEAKAAIAGTACASEEKLLSQLVLTQRRSGDKLHVSLRREGMLSGIFYGNKYAYMKLSGTVPDNLVVQLKIGSGEASISGARIVSADVGSGEADVHRTRGLVAAMVGSGDILVEDAGSLQVISVGSGDLIARRVSGPAKVGSVGSGNLEINDAKGNVEIESVGSGDVSVRNIAGNFSVGSLGSGDINADDIRGDLSVRSLGSGSVNKSGVTGQVTLPHKD